MASDESGDYCRRLLNGFNEIYKSSQFSDVVLSVDGSLFPAHRVILAAGSRYFHALLTSGLSESNKNVITLHEVSVSIMEKVLQFLYSGCIDVQSEFVQELLSAADMLQIPELITLCKKFLVLQLEPANCLGILQLADLHSLVELRHTCENFAFRKFSDIIYQEEFFNLPLNFLLTLLRSENLEIDSENTVLCAAVLWLNHQDAQTSHAHALSVFSCVRFFLISSNILQHYTFACEDPKVRQSLLDCSSQLTTITSKPRRKSKKTIHVLGGYSRSEGGRWIDTSTLSSVDSLDTYHARWRSTASLNVQRSSFSAVNWGDEIYVIGGEDDSLLIDSVEILERLPSVEDQAGVIGWRPGPSLLRPRSELGACVVNGLIYIFGGYVDSGLGTTVEVLDPCEGRWQQSDEVKREDVRVAMGVVECDGLIYVIGGNNEHGFQTNTTLIYDPEMKKWISVARMWKSRAYVCCAELDGRIYAVGGWNENDAVLDSVEAYDIQSDQWTVVASLCSPRAGASVVSHAGSLMVFGGRVGSSEYQASPTLNSTETYDPESDCWMVSANMPTSRCAGAAVAL